MTDRRFLQVDVFGGGGIDGNPVAVVLDAEGLTTDQMQRFASWTNLSETTFVTAADPGEADYRVRIFTPDTELPFAGHPTLGSCHAWLQAGGVPRDPRVVRQACGAGIVQVRRGDALAFAAPPLVRSGPVDAGVREELVRCLQIGHADIVDAAWVDNGPGWVGVLLESAEAVLAIRPLRSELYVGVAGPHPPGSPEALEVRAFVSFGGGVVEDPVTGSVNASLAMWLVETNRIQTPYTARQGTCVGREGRVLVSRDDAGTFWIGGTTTTVVDGHVTSWP